MKPSEAMRQCRYGRHRWCTKDCDCGAWSHLEDSQQMTAALSEIVKRFNPKQGGEEGRGA